MTGLNELDPRAAIYAQFAITISAISYEPNRDRAAMRVGALLQFIIDNTDHLKKNPLEFRDTVRGIGIEPHELTRALGLVGKMSDLLNSLDALDTTAGVS